MSTTPATKVMQSARKLSDRILGKGSEERDFCAALLAVAEDMQGISQSVSNLSGRITELERRIKAVSKTKRKSKRS